MKRIGLSFMALVAMGVMAQKQATQSGTPAVLKVVTGNEARVFLQGLNNGILKFQGHQSTKNMSVPITKIKSLTFYPKYDAEAVKLQFNSGDYTGALSVLVPLMETYGDYMLVDNNLRGSFGMLMDAYLKTEDYTKAREAAAVLQESGDPAWVQRAQVTIALAAIAEEDLDTAKKIRSEASSEAAGLYLQACIERAENRPKDAIQTVSGIIIDHANDIDWLGPSELLCASLYLDMLGPDSAITTNSPLHTSRQVKNMYKGSSVSADAEKIYHSLGGEEIEAAIAAEKEKIRKIEEEQRAERAAAAEKKKAEQEQKKAERRAQKKAEAAAALQLENESGTNVNENAEMDSGTNVNTSTELESE